MLKIFDSCTHPTLTGNWGFNKKIKGNKIASFENLNKQLIKNNYYKACAIGFDNFEKYDHNNFIKECKKYKNLVPIAGLNPKKNKSELKKEIKLIKKLGYKGIKLHPRISNFNLLNKNLDYVFEYMESEKLVLMLCCYPNPSLEAGNNYDFVTTLLNLFKNINSLKVILMHGGCYKLIEISEFVRQNSKNFLLDLSMTILRYKESSIDTDIKYLFRNLDERICIGSDHPEYPLSELKKRFNQLSKGISIRKKSNILNKNLDKFFK
jgi:predicted TIM-barrel fold metal-dependent hydrolase